MLSLFRKCGTLLKELRFSHFLYADNSADQQITMSNTLQIINLYFTFKNKTHLSRDGIHTVNSLFAVYIFFQQSYQNDFRL